MTDNKATINVLLASPSALMNNILSSVTNINNNTQHQQSVPLAERADIHKSCKSLETLLNILNDYCEAATAIVALQKKLAKALRDTAGSKVTNEIAGNALNASANIFEALAEVDAKFVKIADKEYDAISTEVKRWFKRLAKEEKAHDERIANANAKIKQAGLNYEKKSKKKAMDAQEEHSRYIQLISTLGPEITQEKYNHSLQTTQRHTTTIYSVAACLSRIADTEWVRTCESVRRVAPTIGPLAEWRTLCEGGWVKDIPGDLVNLDEKVEDKLILNTIQERVELEEEEDKGDPRQQRNHQAQQQQGQQQLTYEHTPPPPRYRRVDGEPTTPEYRYQHQFNDTPRNDREPTTSTSYSSQAASSSRDSPTLQRHPPNSPHTNLTPPAASASTSTQVSAPATSMPTPTTSTPMTPRTPDRDDSNTHLRAPSPPLQRSNPRSRDESPASDRDRGRLFSDPVTGSVRSLSAFPAPPTHFPLPPPRTRDLPTQDQSQNRSQNYMKPINRERENRDEQTYAARERLSESPLPMEADDGLRVRKDTSGGLAPPSHDASSSSRAAKAVGDPHPERQRSNPTLESPQHQNYDSPNQVTSSPNLNMISAPIPKTPPMLPVIADEYAGRNGTQITKQEELQLREFGVLGEGSGPSGGVAGKARTFSHDGGGGSGESAVEFPSGSAPATRQGGGGLMDRMDTGSSATGSIVAAMKNRYSNAPGSRSPPPRTDLPRLHTSVSDLANRYQSPQPPATVPLPATHDDGELSRDSQSPRVKQSLLRPMSKSPPPAMSRHISLPSTPEKIESRQHGGVSISSSSLTPTASPRPLSSSGMTGTRDSLEGTEDRMQWRRIEELAQVGFRVKERELREREQEIAMRERELERDRARLLALRDGLASSPPSANSSEQGGHDPGNSQGSQLQPRPRERRISFRRSRQDSQPQTPQMRQEQLSPPSRPTPLQAHLIPSSSNPNLRERHQSHHSYSSPAPSSSSNNRDEDLLTSPTPASGKLSQSTGSSTTSHDNPPQQQHQEKKGGWMRRLSMPVGNALPFSLDSSKRHVNNSNSSTTSVVSASVADNPASTTPGVRQLGAGILGGKGVADEPGRRFVQYREREREREKGYQQPHLRQVQDGGRFGGLGLGLGRRNSDASRSATNLNLGSGSRK